MLKPLIISAAALLAMAFTTPTAPPVKWTFNAVQQPNGRVLIELNAEIDQGWHVYATQLPSDQGPLPTAITFDPSEGSYLVEGVKEPDPEKANDPNFGMVLHFHSEAVTFTQLIARRSAEAFTVTGTVEYMACNDQMCLPPLKVPFTIDVPALTK